MKTKTSYINNSFVENISSTQKIPVVNPVTAQVDHYLQEATIENINEAINASRLGFNEWQKYNRTEKSEILFQIADIIEEHREILATIESENTGKPIKLAQTVDIPRSVANFRFFASAILHESENFYQDNDLLNYTLRVPLGTVACIVPWNLPLYLLTWKVAPALAAGNAVIAKPSEFTSSTAIKLAELISKSALPKGIFNVLLGTGKNVGEALVKRPDIKAVSFTGSTHVGKEIASQCAPELKKVSLELGGKNAAIVLPDVSIEETARQLVRAMFTNQGQLCLCASRILIHQNIYEDLKNALVKETLKLKIGLPNDLTTDVGPVVSKQHFEKVCAFINQALELGGKKLCGGPLNTKNTQDPEGYFIAPTLFEGLSNECEVNQNEIFGPVATLIPFKNETEAIQLANTVKYGLSASIWTNDLGSSQRISAQIAAGIVWVNCWLRRDLRTAFGGLKESGVGREGGYRSLHFFTEEKNIGIQQ